MARLERALSTFDGERLLGVVLNESGGADPDYGYEYSYAQGQNGAAAAGERR